MISQETISEIKDRASLAEIVSETVQLKRRGSTYVGLCPFHAEKTPSFHIRDDRYYHCFGCGESGNVISFVMQSRGLSFGEAVEELAQRLGIQVKREGRTSAPKRTPAGDLFKVTQVANQFFVQSLHQSKDRRVLDYLMSRGLTRDAVETFSLGFAPLGRRELMAYLKSHGVSDSLMLEAGVVRRSQRGDNYDTFHGRVTFPVFMDERRIAGFGARILPALFDADALERSPKYLNSPESSIYEKHKMMYGLPQAFAAMRSSLEAFLVEGYLDVIGLWQAGVRNVVATCGTALTAKHVRRLKHLVKRVFVLFDGDEAGRNAAARGFELFLNSGLDASAIFLPEGDDPDTFARRHGPATAEALLQQEQVGLLECYLRHLIQSFGVKDASELGAAAKGRLSEELGKALRQLTNSIEQSELIQQAAMRLRVEPGMLFEVVRGGGEFRLPVTLQQSSVAPTNTQLRLPEVSDLPPVDRQILHAVMAKRQAVIDEIFCDPELCAELHPASLSFMEGLRQVLALPDTGAEGTKEAIRLLLYQYGESWADHWRKSYEMARDPEIDFSRILKECKYSIKKAKLIQTIAAMEQEIKVCSDESQKMQLVQQKLELARQVNQLKRK